MVPLKIVEPFSFSKIKHQFIPLNYSEPRFKVNMISTLYLFESSRRYFLHSPKKYCNGTNLINVIIGFI